VLAISLLAVASLLGWWLGVHHDDAMPPARVIDVIDGDTIVVRFAGGSTDTIRLLGVNTPKTR
jgi:micrococcal nuclease